MSEHRPRSSELESEEELERLFRAAGPRARPPSEHEREIRSALLAEWDAVTRARVVRRRMAAAAAAVVLAVGAALLLPFGPAEQSLAAARVERVIGRVAVETGGGARPLAVGEPLAAGSTVATGAGALALRLGENGSLRLAEGTLLEIVSSAEARLLAGKLYFDSEDHADAPDGRPALVVHAGGTVVRDVGTQFLVRVGDDRVEVGVREGRISLAHGAARADAGAGERLVVGEDRGGIRRESIAPTSADWTWAERLAPPFAIDGRPVAELLEWVAGQTGRGIRYADLDAERTARDTLLRGSVDLEPLPMLTAVLATTDLSHTIEGDTILVETKPR